MARDQVLLLNASIYGLADPATSEIFYVGKSVNPQRRLTAHLRAARQGGALPLHSWLRELGRRPNLVELERVSSGTWQAAETYWIRRCRDLNPGLRNVTPGGEGIDSETASRVNRGRQLTEVSRQKIRDSLNAHFSANGSGGCGKYERKPEHYAGLLAKSTKLTQSEVDQIRSKKAEGMSTADLASEFDISPRHVNDIVAYRRWAS